MHGKNNEYNGMIMLTVFIISGTHLNHSPRRSIVLRSGQYDDNSIKLSKMGLFYEVFEWLSYDREGHLCKNKLIILDKIDTTYFDSS